MDLTHSKVIRALLTDVVTREALTAAFASDDMRLYKALQSSASTGDAIQSAFLAGQLKQSGEAMKTLENFASNYSVSHG